MPASKPTKTSPQYLKRGFKAEAERIALKYRKELNLAETAPMPAIQLAQHLKIQILTPGEIPGITEELLHILLTGQGRDCWSAAIFLKNEERYIIHNPTHSIPRQESNLMHELAHACCNHTLNELETVLTTMIMPLRKYDHTQEAEAEYLGGCLQLPQKALFHYHHILKKSNQDISTIFNASQAMVRFRLSITGVTKIKFR